VQQDAVIASNLVAIVDFQQVRGFGMRVDEAVEAVVATGLRLLQATDVRALEVDQREVDQVRVLAVNRLLQSQLVFTHIQKQRNLE
jgi:hypothetical protein